MPFEVRSVLEAVRWLEGKFAGRNWRVSSESALHRASQALEVWSEKRVGVISSFEAFVNAIEVGDLALQIRHHQRSWESLEKGIRDLGSATCASDSMMLPKPNDASHRLFELRMALAAADFAEDVSLDEPDVRFLYLDVACLIACKVIHGAPGKLSTAQYRDKVQEGLEQLARAVAAERCRTPERDIQCLVAVSLRNHVDHGAFLPPVGDDRVARLSTDQIPELLRAETERFLRELAAGGEMSVATHIERLASEFSHEKRAQVGLLHYQGSTFINKETGIPSPFRRLWARWGVPTELLEQLQAGIQFGDEPPPLDLLRPSDTLDTGGAEGGFTA